MALARKPFVVIDAEILSSSVWSEAAHVRLVWITLLILCDTDGYVGASIPGIAKVAGVTLEEAAAAMTRFQEPDEWSRTKTEDGRRVRVVERGFQILNFTEHLDRLSSERAKSRERVRKHRARKRAKADGNVTVRPGNREQGAGTSEQTDVVGRQVVRSSPPAYPPEQRAENATKETIHGLQLRLGGLLSQLSEHENSRLMVPAWCRMVTSYETTRNGETKKHRGVADYRTVSSIDRLERSVEDAEFWVKEMDGGRVVE